MKEKVTIEGIFPTPIYISSLHRNYSKKENSFFYKAMEKYFKNEGNITSDESYILNKPTLKNIKKILEEHIKIYFEKVYDTKNKIKPYITQSWLNVTNEKEYHHVHNHPNALVSGVLYIKADEKNDNIKFFKDKKHEIIKLIPKAFNWFNSESWVYPVSIGKIIMFPSSTTHTVEIKKGNNTRISLAFNVFVKGNMGDQKSLMELNI
tara:strand:- start:1827 stop:2447 length:621 start_codon:yes stop_codon:yes gene_type:complete